MRLLAKLTCLVALCGLALSALAQQYPARSVRIVVPYTPGGGTDVMARIIAVELSRTLHGSVFVENKPGAGGVIGTDAVAKARPDGYTLGLISSGHAINPALYANMPFDAVSGIAPVIQVAAGPNVVVVNAQVSAKSLAELIALARREPGRVSFGSAGVGNPTHLAGELLQRVTGTTLIHVPYKGSGQAEIALAGGEITMVIDSIPAALPFITSGKTRALAVTGQKRFPLLPEVPTVAEAGLRDFDMTTWWGVVAPPGTPESVIALLNSSVAEVLQNPDVRKQFLQFGAQPTTGSPRQFGEYIRSETERYGKLVKSLGIPPLS
jgi:tripartite-type tricarboxylate transporter receptor subunit TctC